LFGDRFVCAVAADHKLAHRRRVSLADYLRYPHIQIDLERGAQHFIDRTIGDTRNILVSTPFHAFAPEMLIGTDLVLAFPARLAHKFADSPALRILEAPAQLPELTFYSIWHPRLDNDPSRRWLREVTRASAAS